MKADDLALIAASLAAVAIVYFTVHDRTATAAANSVQAKLNAWGIKSDAFSELAPDDYYTSPIYSPAGAF